MASSSVLPARGNTEQLSGDIRIRVRRGGHRTAGGARRRLARVRAPQVREDLACRWKNRPSSVRRTESDPCRQSLSIPVRSLGHGSTCRATKSSPSSVADLPHGRREGAPLRLVQVSAASATVETSGQTGETGSEIAAQRGSCFSARQVEQRVQVRALFVAQRRRKSSSISFESARSSSERLLSIRGQSDDVPAPVVGIATAFDQPRSLELVEQSDQLAAVVAQCVGDRTLGLALSARRARSGFHDGTDEGLSARTPSSLGPDADAPARLRQ